jgi:hypothetical protein
MPEQVTSQHMRKLSPTANYFRVCLFLLCQDAVELSPDVSESLSVELEANPERSVLSARTHVPARETEGQAPQGVGLGVRSSAVQVSVHT